jgi:hypothetical protein
MSYVSNAYTSSVTVLNALTISTTCDVIARVGKDVLLCARYQLALHRHTVCVRNATWVTYHLRLNNTSSIRKPSTSNSFHVTFILRQTQQTHASLMLEVNSDWRSDPRHLLWSRLRLIETQFEFQTSQSVNRIHKYTLHIYYKLLYHALNLSFELCLTTFTPDVYSNNC